MLVTNDLICVVCRLPCDFTVQSTCLPGRPLTCLPERPHTRASPHLSTMASPRLSTRASPHLSTRASPHLSTRASPHLSTRASPHLSTRASPRPYTRASPHLLAVRCAAVTWSVGCTAVLETGPLRPQDHKSGTVCHPISVYVGCHTAVQAVIFIQKVRPRHSVNCFNCAKQKYSYLLRQH